MAVYRDADELVPGDPDQLRRNGFAELADELLRLRAAAAQLYREAELLGLPSGSLTADRARVAAFVRAHPDRADQIAALLGRAVDLRLDAVALQQSESN